MKLLTKEQQESYENEKIYYICKEKFENKYLKDKKFCKVWDHCHYTGEYRDAVHSICNFKYSAPKKLLLFLTMDQTWLSFYYKRVRKRIQFACLGENTEKKPLQFQQENKLQELIKIK